MWKNRYPEIVEELHGGIYVDDLMTGVSNIAEPEQKKSTAIEVFEDAKFTIHKWHSSAPELESTDERQAELEETTYAKSKLMGTEQAGGSYLAFHGTDKKIC